jgi:hypothetical protein
MMKDCHHDAAVAIRSLTEQLEALQHDIERHVQIAADLTEQLDAECRAREVATAEARLIVHVLKEERGAGAEADYYLAQVEQRATAAESKLASVERELEDMRVIAANPLAIQKVHDELGPLSLWSQQGMLYHDKQKERETIERCAKVIRKILEGIYEEHGSYDPDTGATEITNRKIEERAQDLEELEETILALKPTESAGRLLDGVEHSEYPA